MTKFYSRAGIVVLSVYLLPGVGSPGFQRNYRFQQNLEQQIDQLRRQQEQNERQQLNEIPLQPGEGSERRQQLNNLHQQLDQLQLERQQNQIQQQQQLDQ